VPVTRSLTDVLRRHAETQPEKVYWRHYTADQTQTVSFAQLQSRAAEFAAAYAEAGLGKGDVVLIFLPHHIDAPAAFFGAMCVGAIPSFMPCPSAKQHPSIYWPGHADLLRRIGPHGLLTDAHHAAQMREHGLAGPDSRIIVLDSVRPAGGARFVEPDETDIALLQHSSGTTALKKGVALSHRAILLQVDAYAARLRMRAQDNIVSWLPLYHDMGLIACTVAPLVLGQSVTCLDPFQWSARPASLFDAIQEFDGHFTWMPNFGFELLTRAVPESFTADLSSMRAFISCSEPSKPATVQRFRRRFAKLGVRPRHLQVCYAMAETVFAVSQTSLGKPGATASVDTIRLQNDAIAVDAPADRKVTIIASTGAPLPGLDVRILDADGAELPADHVGEVTIAGSFLFDGYFNNPQTTREKIVDGRYRTNDLGFMRAGELFILGRKDDLIIVNGRNLYAHEVEALVARIPGLKAGRAVAFGVFDSELGSETLVVVAERDPDGAAVPERQLGRAVREAVYDSTNIDVHRFLAVDPGWLVKTTSGKISRQHNRAKYIEQLTAVAEPAAALGESEPPSTLRRIADIIGGMFRFPASEIDEQTVAGDVPGWTSLAHAALILDVERQLSIRFEDQEMFSFATVGDLVRRAEQLQAQGGIAAPDERVVHRSATAAIMRFQGAGTGPDLIIFAGRANKLAGMELLDFASLLGGGGMKDLTKYYVTDLAADWYLSCFDEVVAALNEAAPGPKLLLGNSMGGYAALRFAPVLSHVHAVLAFVPQSEPVRPAARKHGIEPQARRVGFAPNIPTCVLFGETEDEADRAHLSSQAAAASGQQVIVVPNCGHNVVPYLHSMNVLDKVIDCLMRPAALTASVDSIVATIPADPDLLERRERYMKRRKARAEERRRLRRSHAGA
jgi:acyl-CoA synthetase (AMP-forming)/AMP-acid ligase II/acyl carrier protein